MSATREIDRSDYQETIEEVDGELTRVVGEFGRAMNVEALRRTKETGKHSFTPSLDR